MSPKEMGSSSADPALTPQAVQPQAPSRPLHAPWSVSPMRSDTILDASGIPVARAYGSRHRKDSPAPAGRLIAAAPELLEALADVLALARLKWGNLDAGANTVFAAAKAAIAKAEGRSRPAKPPKRSRP